ncbi:MAG: DUF3943 domain-containing protein [Bacteroidia bacterium]
MRLLLPYPLMLLFLYLYFPSVLAQTDIILSSTDFAFTHQDQHIPSAYTSPELNFRNANKGIGPKIIRGNFLCASYNLSIGAGLFLLPSDITNWERSAFLPAVGPNLRRAWTRQPVWDNDGFIINYIGHSYQGAWYYNSIRSQGAKVWEASLFCLGQSLLWEYGYEAVKEQPSRQDLFTTPLGGIFFGELTHRITRRMRRRGFNFGEKVFITAFNPSYVLNNGYR